MLNPRGNLNVCLPKKSPVWNISFLARAANKNKRNPGTFYIQRYIFNHENY